MLSKGTESSIIFHWIIVIGIPRPNIDFNVSTFPTTGNRITTIDYNFIRLDYPFN